VSLASLDRTPNTRGAPRAGRRRCTLRRSGEVWAAGEVSGCSGGLTDAAKKLQIADTAGAAAAS